MRSTVYSEAELKNDARATVKVWARDKALRLSAKTERLYARCWGIKITNHGGMECRETTVLVVSFVHDGEAISLTCGL